MKLVLTPNTKEDGFHWKLEDFNIDEWERAKELPHYGHVFGPEEDAERMGRLAAKKIRDTSKMVRREILL